MNCTYCNRSIERDEPGWGFMQSELGYVDYHLECLEISEEVVV